MGKVTACELVRCNYFVFILWSFIKNTVGFNVSVLGIMSVGNDIV